MDLLYSRYASPFELMDLYINQGRFGELVSEILEMDFKRKKEAAEKENDDRLWSLYIRSMSEKTFIEWKEDLKDSMQKNNSKNMETNASTMSGDDVKTAIQRSQAILSSFVPEY